MGIFLEQMPLIYKAQLCNQRAFKLTGSAASEQEEMAIITKSYLFFFYAFFYIKNETTRKNLQSRK